MTDALLNPGPEVPRPKLSADRRRTLRNNSLLDAGRHPVSGRRLADNGETCGTCSHHFAHTRSRTWHKCDLNVTGGPATDIRVGWPACTAWEAS